MPTPADQSRLRDLLQAGIALTSELSLDAVLTMLVETAASVTRARYAALGVLDPTHTALERFIAVGIDDGTRARIGELPRGRGILGVLIRDAKALRLRELTEDPRAVGFPPGHPPMHSFLGVPVLLRGVAYGNLYLTEKEGGGEFGEEDEELVTLLAAQAAVAIENARLYETSTAWLRQREALDTIANELVSEIELPRLLALVAESLRELIDARIVTVWLPAPDGALRLETSAGEWPDELAATLRPNGDGKLSGVLARGRSERVDTLLDDPEIDQRASRRLGLKSGLWVPLLVRGRPVGIIAAHDRVGADSRFSEQDQRVAETLAARAAAAVDLHQRLSRETVRSMLRAQERERKRIARELHDETGQALTSILLALKPLEAEVGTASIAPVHELVAEALADVRRLAVELRPAILDDFGLVPALERLVRGLREKREIDVQLHSSITDERLPDELETALYRIAQEALTNVVKHARAGRAHIRLWQDDGSVRLVIEDDGDGFSAAEAPPERLGLTGIRERVELLAGRLTIESEPGEGACLVAELPLEGAYQAVGHPRVETQSPPPGTST